MHSNKIYFEGECVWDPDADYAQDDKDKSEKSEKKE